MVLFNGTDDQDVYWNGLPNTEFAFLSIPDLFKKWAGLSNCIGEPDSEFLPDSVSHIDVEKLTYAWCEDVGYLFSKDAKMLKIFTSYSYDGDKLSIGTVTVFPRSIVKKIEVLK